MPADTECAEWNADDRTVEDCIREIRKTAALLKGVIEMAATSDDLVNDMTHHGGGSWPKWQAR